jgi:hypothetical protein
MNKPKITINGTDNIYDIAMKARSAMRQVCDIAETDKVINEFFEDVSIATRMSGIERYLDVTYNFTE